MAEKGDGRDCTWPVFGHNAAGRVYIVCVEIDGKRVAGACWAHCSSEGPFGPP